MISKPLIIHLRWLISMVNSKPNNSGAASRRFVFKVTSLVVSIGLILGIMAVMAWGISNQKTATSLSGYMLVNNPPPNFTLDLFDGTEMILSDLRGRPLVINFWFPSCHSCHENSRVMEQSWRRYQDNGVVFVGIDIPSIEDTQDDAKNYLKEFGVTYPNGFDIDGKIMIDYGVTGVPATFLVSQDWIIQYRYVGAIPEKQLSGWIDELIAEKIQVVSANLDHGSNILK